MKSVPTYRWWAALLVLLVSLTWGIRTGHGIWLHHSEGTPHCDPARDGDSAHFHADAGEARDCPVCAFCFSLPELLSITALVLAPAAMPDSSSPLFAS